MAKNQSNKEDATEKEETVVPTEQVTEITETVVPEKPKDVMYRNKHNHKIDLCGHKSYTVGPKETFPVNFMDDVLFSVNPNVDRIG